MTLATRRFYRARRSVFLVLTALVVAAPVEGQAPALPDQPLLGSTLSTEILEDLPTGNSPFVVLETIQAETIGNRFATGLTVSPAPQVGGLLNSWTQTQYRIGDVSITDPRAGGTPLILPLLPVWRHVTTATGAMDAGEEAAAVSMTLEPVRPGTSWVRSVEGSLSGEALVASTAGPVPPVDRLNQWQDGSVLVSGPVTDRLGIVGAGLWRHLSHIAVPGTIAMSDRVASGFAHLVFAMSPRDEIRALGWAQQVTTGALTDTGVHVQSTWDRHGPAAPAWRVFGGYTERHRTAPMTPTLVVDSLTSDPVSDLVDVGAGTARRWVIGGRVSPKAASLLPRVGFDIEGAQMSVSPSGVAQILELVDSAPARAWTFRGGTGTDVRALTSMVAYGNEHLTSGHLTLDAGLRLDTVSGAADGSAGRIRWATWLPSAMLRYHVTDTAGLELVASYRRAAYQLPLNVLAVGDPAAPIADISVWSGKSTGPPFVRVGPGTGGDPTFTQIDAALRRPTTDELVLALQARPMRGVQFELARVTKREQPLLGLVDTGVAASEYTAFQVPDPSFLPDSPVGAAQVTAYNRPPGAYGRDRYLLTNQSGDPAKSWGLQANLRVSNDRFTLLFGGNLTWATGPAAAVGFLPTENDQDVLGNTLVDPNTATAARGQLFQDRSHVVKIAGIFSLPWQVRLGMIARYQDGQPFARLVVAPASTQGPTAVRSYTNGGSAFTYTGTLDVRVQRSFTTRGSEVTAMLDVYNLPNLGNEVVEYVVTGPAFRTPTALQPPLTTLVGMRVRF